MAFKKKVAAALKYDAVKDNAPRVVAAGHGRLAALIEEEARKAGVPVYEDPELACTLTALGVRQEIPPVLYEAVAQVIAWVYRLENEAIRKKEGEEQ
ncbi:MAG: EscU/YscU/HrcU family type III secretion system export apparatus switch protein [Peptococcaceae bacterium]|nr:EscU/YscU/HrcU family type III secretion system export apparatus switch protein [Peptococcaceae bacterium]